VENYHGTGVCMHSRPTLLETTLEETFSLQPFCSKGPCLIRKIEVFV